ncbi:HTTM domain-containing protein [Prosthecobacter sp.]|uniref:HTTM domain-containing protein n=1 Tax=Prosthecobacter sp. TaxID=1965333 RepID=UPI003784AFEE
MITPCSPGPEGAVFRAFPVFALIWGVTTLVHQLAFTFWAETWQGWLLTAAAVQVIFQPACVLRFALLVGTALLHLWDKLPFVPNHILFEGMLHVTMGVALVEWLVRGKGFRGLLDARWGPTWGWLLLAGAAVVKGLYVYVPGMPRGLVLDYGTTLLVPGAFTLWLRGLPVVEAGGEEWFSRFAPVMRAAVVIMYGWAGIQKLNWDYLNPETSCAAVFHREIAACLGWLIPTGSWTLRGAIWGSYAFEFGIPVLLMFGRTRRVGFAAAVVFHLWLSIHPAAGIFSYSSLMFALLAVFLPVEWGARLLGLWRRQLAWLGRGDEACGRRLARWAFVVLFFAALLCQVALYLFVQRDQTVFKTANRIGFAVFWVWGCWLGGCYLLASRGAGERRAALPLPFGWRWTAAWVGLLPVLVNGLMPWIGSRTETSYSMFSNLRSEGAGNHLFLRRADVFALQTDLVQVVASEPDVFAPGVRPRSIQHFGSAGHFILPWFEFRRLISEVKGDFRVRYRRGEAKEVLQLGRSHGEVFGDVRAFEPLPYLEGKLLWSRRLKSLEEPMCCTH